ncbi:MarR family transcriptional regulator [Sorangium sp. So ce429]
MDPSSRCWWGSSVSRRSAWSSFRTEPRDHTTVSRQVAELESLGLIERRPGPADRRIHEAVITDKGRQMTDALDAARQRLAAPVLARWSEEDFSDLVRLMRRFVDDLMAPSRRWSRAVARRRHACSRRAALSTSGYPRRART